MYVSVRGSFCGGECVNTAFVQCRFIKAEGICFEEGRDYKSTRKTLINVCSFLYCLVICAVHFESPTVSLDSVSRERKMFEKYLIHLIRRCACFRWIETSKWKFEWNSLGKNCPGISGKLSSVSVSRYNSHSFSLLNYQTDFLWFPFGVIIFGE